MKKTPLILLTSIMLSAYSYVAYGDIEYGSEQHGLRENDGREAHRKLYRRLTKTPNSMEDMNGYQLI